MNEIPLETPPETAAAEEPATTVITAVASAMDTRLMRVECSFTRGFAGLTMIGNTDLNALRC